jgi:hypothetical protein
MIPLQMLQTTRQLMTMATLLQLMAQMLLGTVTARPMTTATPLILTLQIQQQMTPPIIIILLIQIPPFEAPQTLQQEEDKEEGGFLNS